VTDAQKRLDQLTWSYVEPAVREQDQVCPRGYVRELYVVRSLRGRMHGALPRRRMAEARPRVRRGRRSRSIASRAGPSSDGPGSDSDEPGEARRTVRHRLSGLTVESRLPERVGA
jgi:hypothetical protein